MLAMLAGCGGSHVAVGSSVGQSDSAEAEPAEQAEAGGAGGAGGAADGDAPAQQKARGPAPEPPPDPALVKALVARTGEAIVGDNALHLRLEVTPQPAGQRWLVAVVNRGTEPASVLFDLRGGFLTKLDLLVSAERGLLNFHRPLLGRLRVRGLGDRNQQK